MSHLSRRLLLQMGAAATFMSTAPMAFAQGVHGRKFVFVLLRGAMDGLSAVIPDAPEIELLRGSLLPDRSERLNLNNGFRLHPAFKNLNSIYKAGDAIFIHAASTSFRGRSHFDGQDVMERMNGSNRDDGWINRALQAQNKTGLAVGYSIPLAMQGSANVTNWSPSVFPEVSDALLSRLGDLYAGDPLFSNAMNAANMTPDISGMGDNKRLTSFAAQMTAAGRLMSAPGGPNVGMISLGGWDTHAHQLGTLNRRFKSLDAAIGSLKSALGPHWQRTCVVMCSEFGRTVAANGTGGTDHGTGGLVTLFGGAVKGGRISGKWPGVSSRSLYENRDLAPANDIGAILKGVLRDHLGIDRRRLETSVLPGSGRTFDGLIV